MLSGCRSTRSHLSQVNPLLSPDPSYFEDRALSSGINFQLGHGGRSPLTILETMGTGCAIFDYDGDGYADILLIGQTGTQTAHCSLFHNNGNGTFTDVTRGSGLEQPGLYMGCAVGDFDNDGRPDVLLTGYGVLRLFRNLGQGRFEDVSKDVGLYSPSPTSWHSSAIFADFDRDGYLDLYVARYVVFNSHTIQLCNYGQYKSSCGPIFYDPQIGSLYRNIKGQRFEEITQEAGLTAAHGKTLGVAVADVNGDGWPDIYLANDEMPGDLFINNKGKAFHNEGLLRGVALNGAGQMQGGMGVDFGDYDNDGLLDLFVATFENEPDVLYQASKSGIFMDMSIPLGIATITRPLVGFGCKFLDIDNDGWLDLAIANGHIHDNEDLVDTQEHYRQPMLLFHNQNGQLFADITAKGGMGFTTPMVGRGLAIGDLNNDGRMDIVTVDLEGKARLLINQFPNPGNWIRITLEGRQSNRMGIGARVTVYAEGKRWVKECTTGGSYLSASDVRLHFGLGTAKSVEKIEVHWPSGKQSIVTPLRINRDITIVET
ncbi:MAG TPA: CRTAC1 family protein [Chthonomonas sp.]|uniref:CRTAC1 family protein n=1 Tax=Chthonomonas sp. TaxID=2282153 RepID=UPI002B4B6793|nr:CRTAC1 family protein [Chthonomonas sp.]HLI47892.1 CRTAC1 family protein [Chthonomonas sp.]